MAISGKIPTPDGWVEAQKIKAGDYLLDEAGNPAPVLSATTYRTTTSCYRVKFRDGTTIVASEDHVWPVREFYGRYRNTAVTSKVLAERGVTFDRALTAGKTKASKGGVARWRTRPTPALNLAEAPMPMPPYLLGYWLGDGDSDGPRITVSEDDLPHLEGQLTRLGARIISRQRTHGKTFRIRFDLGSRASGVKALRELEVLHAKHIPGQLLRASDAQRRQLLQGLVDSDGYIEAGTSRVEIGLTSERLIIDTVDLIRTLGLYPRLSVGDAKLNGRRVGTRYRAVFTAYDIDQVSRLPRKSDRLKRRGETVPYSQVRTITEITPLGSSVVTTLRVSATGGTYLAGEGLVPVCDYA
ncbi:LAGLIDADG family homing endonuclease [Streptomyces noursei]